MRVAVLGASGFLGKNLAQSLILDGHEVTSFVREKTSTPGVDLGRQVAFDFSSLHEISETLNSFDSVVHLVSSTNPARSSHGPRVDAQENLLSSLDLMEILKDNPSVRLVFVSSGGAVYGVPEVVPISESHSTNPVSFYGVSKLAIEKYLHVYSNSNKLNYVVLRLSNPFGPGQVNTKGQGLVPTIIESALLGRKLSVWGDGTNVRDYIYVDDAVDALKRAILHEGQGALFNIGSGQGASILQIVAQVEEITGKSVTLAFQPARAFDSPVNVLDVSLAKDVLSWTPATGLREGLEKTVVWNQKRLKADDSDKVL